MDLPASFVAAITGSWPVEGPAFLAHLPELIRTFEQRWQITASSAFALSYNYVVPAVLADGTEAVLKLGVPNPEFTTEIESLRLYGGRGAARLIDADAERGALLLERVRPGIPLAELEDDDDATSIAAGVMRKLWQPLPASHAFPDLRRWTQSLCQYAGRYHPGEAVAGPLPPDLVDRAMGHLRDLLAAPLPPVLIHGDFHHWNVLSATREPWLAIDPKGMAAEPAFDVGPLFYNPMPRVFGWPDLKRITRRRLDLLTERLELDRQRLAACAFVAAVLSACWSVEEGNGGVEEVIAVAAAGAEAKSPQDKKRPKPEGHVS
jgi:streptomycin 6-kinase